MIVKVYADHGMTRLIMIAPWRVVRSAFGLNKSTVAGVAADLRGGESSVEVQFPRRRGLAQTLDLRIIVLSLDNDNQMFTNRST